MTLIIILLTLLGLIVILQGLRLNYIESHYLPIDVFLSTLEGVLEDLREHLVVSDEEDAS